MKSSTFNHVDFDRPEANRTAVCFRTCSIPRFPLPEAVNTAPTSICRNFNYANSVSSVLVPYPCTPRPACLRECSFCNLLSFQCHMYSRYSLGRDIRKTMGSISASESDDNDGDEN